VLCEGNDLDSGLSIAEFNDTIDRSYIDTWYLLLLIRSSYNLWGLIGVKFVAFHYPGIVVEVAVN
jgi:hypothetical protein